MKICKQAQGLILSVIIALAIGLLLSGCGKDPATTPSPTPPEPPIILDEQTIVVSTNNFTRAAYQNEGLTMTWSEEDELYLEDSEGLDFIFSLKDPENGIFKLSGVSTKPEDAQCELIFPAAVAYSKVISMEGQKQVGNNNDDHLGSFSVLTASKARLDETISMQHKTAQIKFLFTLPEELKAESISKLRFSSLSEDFIISQNLDGSNSTMSDKMEIELEIANDEVNAENNRLLTVYAMILPPTFYNATIKAELLDSQGKVLFERSEENITRTFAAGYQHFALLTDMLDLTGGTIISSSDVTWEQFGPGMSGNNKSGFWHPTDPNYLYISPNMGNSYVSDNAGLSYETVLDWDAAGYKDASRGVNEFMSLDFSRQNDAFGYATDSSTKGMFKTTNKGRNWTLVETSKLPSFNKSHLACVTVDPTDDKIWYLGAGRMRDDAQLLFSDTYPHGHPESISINSQKKLWKSSDGGETWTLKTNGLHANCEAESILVDPANPKRVYLSTNYGFYLSSDGGENWSKRQLRTDVSNEVIRSLAMHHDKKTSQTTLFAISNVMWRKDLASKTMVNAGGGVYKSTDQGENWVCINGSGEGSLSINLAALDEYGNKSIFNSYANPTSYQLGYYIDGDHDKLDKTSFAQDLPNHPTSIMQRVSMVIVDPNDVDNLYLINDYSNASRNNFLPGEMWRSSNGGASWHVCARLGARWDKNKTSSDDWKYWESRGNPLGNNIELRYLKQWEQRAEYDSKSFTFAAFNADGSVLHAQLAKISLMSYDKGLSWVDIDDQYTDEINSPDSYVGAGNSNVPGHGFYQHPSLEGQVFCSGGENSLWITNSEKLNDPERPDAQAATNIRFTDNEMSLSCYAVHPHDTNIHFALFFRQHNMGQLMRSTDGGKTWEVYSDDDAHPIPKWEQEAYSGDQSVHQLCLLIDPSNPNNMYFCVPWKASILQYVGDSKVGFGVHRSTDGGKRWESCNMGLPNTVFKNEPSLGAPSVTRIALDPKDSNTIYAAVELRNGGLFVSKDRGTSWSEVESTAFLTPDLETQSGINDIHFSQDGAVYVTVGSQNAPLDDKFGGVWVSYDNMLSWRKIFSAPYPSRIESARYDPKLLLVSVLSNVVSGYVNPGTYLSRDGGATWQKINAGNGQSDRVNDIAIDYSVSGKYYASTYGSGWYVATDNGY